MKKTLLGLGLALAALVNLQPAVAESRNAAKLDHDTQYCNRNHGNFDRCMSQRGWERGRNQRWEQEPSYRYDGNQGGSRQREQPRLSDMQQRALNNCMLLQRSEQSRCRATVMSTVR